MSKERTPELSKSWVVVDSEKIEDNGREGTSNVQDVVENESHVDSDTDSISVISESGCSYKTDEEEGVPNEIPVVEELKEEVKDTEPENEPRIIENELDQPKIEENKRTEKLLYLFTSAACAIILIGFSVAVQHYFKNTSDVDNFEPEQQSSFSYVQNLKIEKPKIRHKRKGEIRFSEFENKIAKIEENKQAPNKPVSSDDVNLEMDKNYKSNYETNRNKVKSVKCKKNSESHKPVSDDNYNMKIKELKIKEDYLNEKEKFLLEKEHALLKKEIKLDGKNKRKKQEKENFHKEKQWKDSLDEKSKKEKKYKSKKFSQDNNNGNDYRRKTDEMNPKFKFSNEQNKKHNISGQWFINRHEGRDNMRQTKRSSYYRRNKAHWYFQWMVDRARLRIK